MKTTAIVTDIEGTTTDIQFVHRVLFPYAYEKLADFVREHAQTPPLAPILEQAREELGDPDADLETLITAFRHWIEQDRKVTPLKTLQGLIWVQGYSQEDFKGHLYEDAYRHLERWHRDGIGLYVFSSGSVRAQKLLFGYSDFGDLTPWFSGYFDTTTGPKRDADAYRQIVATIGCPANEILFLSDVVEELDAAREAGLRTCLLARDEKPEEPGHPVAATFDEISV
ncbi:enolase-phosphatase E1 [Marinobacterium nitratireducens]|uniref:Enolase-phosphatase E1 n=1 Tax=Marinobacterium nitratireducens TaxID=518897 RepID=A0A917ZAU1_9GAMM|nr:acireductone synthase [Marinobacterium nitratireducens]GGO79676.1 enolase-phosphatase E1 [Marinobacterium nitratireducens]